MAKGAQVLIIVCVVALCLTSAFYGLHADSGKYRVLDVAKYMKALGKAFNLAVHVSPVGLIGDIFRLLQDKNAIELVFDSVPDVANMIMIRVYEVNMFWENINPANSLKEIEINTSPY